MTEAHGNAALRIGAVLERGNVALFRVGCVQGSVCPRIMVVERMRRVLVFGVGLSRVMLGLDLINMSARGVGRG